MTSQQAGVQSVQATPRLHLVRRPAVLAFLVVLVLDLLVAAYLAQNVVAFQHYPFDADEANHAIGGLSMSLALQDGDVGRFVSAFYQRDFYPPGVDWLKALAFWAFGTSPLVARLFSVGSFFLAIPVIYLAGLEMNARRGWLIGLIGALLTLTMQPLLVSASLVMTEPPGLLVSFGLLYVYLRVLKRPARRRLLLTSGLLLFAFLTKYTFGVVLTATVVFMELSLWLEALWRPGLLVLKGNEGPSFSLRLRAHVRSRWLWLFGPFLLLMLLWLVGGQKAATFLDYTRPLTDDEAWFTLSNMLFYPRSIALHDVPSPIFALVTAAAILWSAYQWRVQKVRLLLLYFLLGMLAIMLVNHPVNPRFIVTFVPGAHLLTGAFIAWLIGQVQSGNGRLALTGLGLTALLLVVSLPTIHERYASYPSLMEAAVETSPEATAMAQWISEQIPSGAPVLLINYWDQFSPPALAWHMGARTPAMEVPVSGIVIEESTSGNLRAVRQAVLASGAEYAILLEGSPWGAPFWPDYTATLEDVLQVEAREKFHFQQYAAQSWIERSLLTRSAWESAKDEAAYEMDVEAIVYRVHRP